MTMDLFFKTFVLFISLFLCKEGECFSFAVVKVKVEVCQGDNATLAVRVTGGDPNLLYVRWYKNLRALVNGEHHGIGQSGIYLYLIVRNASLDQSGLYFGHVKRKSDHVLLSLQMLQLIVYDVYLRSLVKSPVITQVGDNTILKVEKSEWSTLVWKHNGSVLTGKEPHYTFPYPNKTELEISNTGSEQAGVYEVFLIEGECEKREEIKVQTGKIKIWPISSHSDICTGEKASFAVEVTNYFDGFDFQVIWRYNTFAGVQENDHFSLWGNNTALDVHDALPFHSGNYTAFAVLMQKGSLVNSVFSFTSFLLRVHDVFLNASVESPIKIEAGDSAILKVVKSDLGTLFWTHGDKLVDDHDPHYTFLNANKTALEIVAASLKQGGIYKIVLKEGECDIIKVIEVQIYEERMFVKGSNDTGNPYNSEFFVIVIRGFFRYKWYIASAAGGGLLLIVIVLVIRFGRRIKKKNSTKKNDGHRDDRKELPRERVERQSDDKKGQPRQHVLLQQPILTIQKEAIYTSADQTFPAYADNSNMTNTYARVDNLGQYGHRSHNSVIMSPVTTRLWGQPSHLSPSIFTDKDVW